MLGYLVKSILGVSWLPKKKVSGMKMLYVVESEVPRVLRCIHHQ